jgi:aspartyl aminopeptidase
MLAAALIGEDEPARAGMRVLGAHTDSPNLRVKPLPDLGDAGYAQLALEPYGGVLLHTWLDRDLSLAGRLVVHREGRQSVHLVDFGRSILRVPSLAIHLHREIREEGLRLNPQAHLAAISGLNGASGLRELLAAELGAKASVEVAPTDIAAFDLMTYDVTRASLGGIADELVCASRLDNLASCHAAVSALVSSARRGAARTRALVLYDHEEVGSRSTAGAGGPFLGDFLERLVLANGGGRESSKRALSASLLVSVDMAHAVHPNWADRHERGHRPVIGKGPVLKVNVNQSYATDAETAGAIVQAARACGTNLQHFVARSDFVCGSTIGPIAAARTGIATVDVGNPMLAMHSCRETAGAADVEPMIRVLEHVLES